LILCFHIYPGLKRSFLIDTKIFRHLFSFGGWISLCNILIPILVNFDRFLIGALLTTDAVGYYSVCYDTLSRLQIFPGTLATVLFPAFSALGTNKDRLERLYARALKYLLLIMGPIVLILVIFSGYILHLWLGSDWASKTTLVFQILAVGILINALAQIPANLLDGIGRPDLRAKIFLLYVLPYVLLLWFLIIKFGIVGAALAWTLRACIELLFFFGITWKLMDFKPAIFIENRLLRSLFVYGGIFVTELFVIITFPETFLMRGFITGICLIVLVLISWKYILDNNEKESLFLVIKKK
jgi:O-antigen/teichoic acid export membrane protein